MVEIDELKCCGLFADLNDRELEEVAKLATVEKRGAGARIIAEGTAAGALYLLQSGKVAVRMSSRDGHEVLIDELGPGDIFGWSAVLDDQMFKAAIWALEDCTIVVMDGDRLKKLFDANNHIGYRAVRMIAGITANRLEKLRSRLVDQPFSTKYLEPARTATVPVTGEKSEMRAMACPECSTPNRPFAVVNDTEQYRCRNCGMIYYSPVGCETGPVIPSAGAGSGAESQLGDNWLASTPASD
jgi:CRP/FNR family transcriptional regulator, cyclic AMP receptor protein